MPHQSRLLLSLAAAIALLLPGCKTENTAYSYDDSRNPYFQKAEAAAAERNPDGAIAAYEEALRTKPGLAEAHRQLGLLYSEQKHDSIRAVYHFNQYLDLRPNGEQRESVQKLMDREALTFAASLAHSPIQNAEVFAAIQSENATLKQQLQSSLKTVAELEKTIDAQNRGVAGASSAAPSNAELASTAPASNPAAMDNSIPIAPAPKVQAAPVTTALPPVPSIAGRTYTIKSGDSLWKISSQFYRGDVKNGVEKIKQANANLLADGRPLKIGTVLTIP